MNSTVVFMLVGIILLFGSHWFRGKGALDPALRDGNAVAMQGNRGREAGFATKDAMQIFISVVLLAAGIYVILTNQPDTQQKWATGVIGSVVGFWLKG